MNYEQRLKAAAHLILSKDAMVDAHPPFNSEEVGVQAVLKPHQIDGVSWLIRRYVTGVNVILGDEMGLGKTLQAVSFLSYLKVHQMSPGPFLVLCPLSVTDGWMSEFTKFCPSLKVLRYVGDKSSRRELRRTIYEHVKQQSPSPNLGLPFDVLLTTYDIALLDQDFLSQFPWHYTVIDEAQRIKNPSSVLYQTLEQSFVMPRRLLMTGTPIQNNLGELWALMHFCMPMVFGTSEQFLSTFKESGNLSSGCEAAKIKENLKVLKYIMSAFMLRRTKSMLIESGTLTLPRLTEITVMVPLVPLQKKVYLSILKKELPQLLAVSTGASSHQSLQNIVIQLRKACSHPYLFNGIEPEPYEEGEHLVQASGKLTILDKLLQTLHSSGHRVLVFAQMTHTLDILQDFLELRGYMYDRLDGSIRAEERFAAIRSFSQKPSEGFNQERAFVFLISTRAGGVGLNLVAADTVIFYEQDWNPQVDKQALQRTHRIGQTNHVLSINLVTSETVEEVIMRRAERKLQLSHNVIGKDDNTHQRNKELLAETGDLRSIIFGLHKFDPTDSIGGDTSGMDMEKLKAMSEKVVEMRDHEPSEMDDRKFEINPSDLSHGDNLSVRQRDLSKFDIGLDEASYMSWVEKFKEASKSIESGTPELGRKRKPTESTPLKSKVDSSKAEEKKLAKWETLGYQSLAVKHPIFVPDNDIMSESGSVQFVYGDCTNPYNICPSEPTVIFSCADNSGNWGHGGMFDALENLSGRISEAYERASECGDLHLGDLHFIKVKGGGNIENNLENAPQWVALAVVQSYNPRRKVPRSNISIPDLEQCLLKASFSAAQNSASIHMPRIGYQNGTDRSEWYTVERILRKYASTYGIKIFVYYYRRPA